MRLPMGLANLALFSLRRTARLRLTTGKHNAQSRFVTPRSFFADCVPKLLGGFGQRVALISDNALCLRQAKFLAYDIRTEHHRDHLVVGVTATHAFTAHAAIG